MYFACFAVNLFYRSVRQVIRKERGEDCFRGLKEQLCALEPLGLSGKSFKRFNKFKRFKRLEDWMV